MPLFRYSKHFATILILNPSALDSDQLLLQRKCYQSWSITLWQRRWQGGEDSSYYFILLKNIHKNIRQSSVLSLLPRSTRITPIPTHTSGSVGHFSLFFRTHQNSAQTGTVCTSMHTWKATKEQLKKKATMGPVQSFTGCRILWFVRGIFLFV